MGIFRRKPSQPTVATGAAQPSARPDLASFAAERVASHDPGWTLQGSTVVTDVDGIRIDVAVQEPGAAGSQVSVPLFFSITGDRIAEPVFASFSGYGPTLEAAVVEGACLWTCSFGPVLRQGYGGRPDDEVQLEEVEVDGTKVALVSSALGRAMMTADGDPQAEIDETRVRFGAVDGRSLSSLVVASGTLPPLGDEPMILSTFVFDSEGARTVEVKVNGSDWLPSTLAFDHVPGRRGHSHVLLRELAVLTPAAPAGRTRPEPGATELPSRPALQRTLDGLAMRHDVGAAAWPGWEAHGGRLGAPVSRRAMNGLPPAYQRLLRLVGAGGAGPGYGLLAPRVVDGVVPLAHAGCGCSWVLRLDPDHAGEVWADASGSDETYTRVAGSATEWYLRWLDHAVRSSRPWVQWNVGSCASAGTFSQVLDSRPRRTDGQLPLAGLMRERSMALHGGGPYLEGGPQPMDPCEGCVDLAAQLGLDASIFIPGVLRDPSRAKPAS